MPKLHISARSLYAYLEPTLTFRSWIRDSCENYGYKNGEDWIKTLPDPDRQEPFNQVDYLLSSRFAAKLTDIETRRREQRKRRRPVVEYVYTVPKGEDYEGN